MGFYPANPVSGEYVVGSYVVFIFPSTWGLNAPISPFFEKLVIDLPPPPETQRSFGTGNGPKRTLTIIAPGAQTKPYIRSLTVNGKRIDHPLIKHDDIKDGGEIVFEMSEKVERWGNDEVFGTVSFQVFRLAALD